MILEKLQIELNKYGQEKGKYSGKVRFVGDSGAVELSLSAGQLSGILHMCSDAIIEQSKFVAEALVAPLIDFPVPKFLTD